MCPFTMVKFKLRIGDRIVLNKEGGRTKTYVNFDLDIEF